MGGSWQAFQGIVSLLTRGLRTEMLLQRVREIRGRDKIEPAAQSKYNRPEPLSRPIVIIAKEKSGKLLAVSPLHVLARDVVPYIAPQMASHPPVCHYVKPA